MSTCLTLVVVKMGGAGPGGGVAVWWRGMALLQTLLLLSSFIQQMALIYYDHLKNTTGYLNTKKFSLLVWTHQRGQLTIRSNSDGHTATEKKAQL